MNPLRTFSYVFGLLFASLGVANAQCPNVAPGFEDLEKWVHGNVQNDGISHNYIEVQVTMVNPKGHTVWGKSRFMQGVESQCILTTNPSLPLFFSDRTGKILGQDNHGNSVKDMRQPFSILSWDEHIVSLDMVNSTITNKSRTWNFTSKASAVKRSQNIIYGTDGGGGMIILTLLKRTFTGPVAPAIEP